MCYGKLEMFRRKSSFFDHEIKICRNVVKTAQKYAKKIQFCICKILTCEHSGDIIKYREIVHILYGIGGIL